MLGGSANLASEDAVPEAATIMSQTAVRLRRRFMLIPWPQWMPGQAPRRQRSPSGLLARTPARSPHALLFPDRSGNSSFSIARPVPGLALEPEGLSRRLSLRATV
jgi:hypothetical protein